MPQRIHGGNITDFISKNKIPARKVIDFSANINPLGLPGRVRSIIQESIDALIHYPQAESKPLKKDLAKLHRLSPQNLLLGNGSIELIHLIPYALRPKRALIALPAFSEYERAARNSNAGVKFIYPSNNGRLKIDIAQILDAIPKAELVFIANPNNPTGELLPGQDILSIAKKCLRQRVFLVIDEVFLDFAEGRDDLSMLSYVLKNKYLIVIRSLTKFFAIAGLRLGYLAGHSGLIKKISPFQYPWAVNTLAQAAGRAVIRDKRYARSSKRLIARESRFLLGELKKINGISAYPSQANFILCKINRRNINAPKLCRLLAKDGIMVRDCSDFRALDDSFFRVAVRKRGENLRLRNSLKKAFSDA